MSQFTDGVNPFGPVDIGPIHNPASASQLAAASAQIRRDVLTVGGIKSDAVFPVSAPSWRGRTTSVYDQAVLLSAAAPTRVTITLQNLDATNLLFVDDAQSVSAASATILPGYSLTLATTDAVYATCASGFSALVSFIETYR